MTVDSYAFVCVFTIVGIWIGVGPAAAQHFSNCLTPQDTGTGATLAVEDTVIANFPNGSSLQKGDELAVYTSDGTCAGTVTWPSSPEPTVSIPVAGPSANETESGESGYSVDEPLKMKVWDASEETEYDIETSIEYNSCGSGDSLCRDDGLYESGVVYTAVQLGGETLPVELTNLTATQVENRVRLSWQTARESNNAHFEVQHRCRADTPASWTTLGQVEGHGTTEKTHTYRYRTSPLEPGRHQFRLRQVDVDGTAHLSKTVSVRLHLEAPYSLTPVTPHPVQRRSHVTLRVRKTQDVTVSMYNTLGQRTRVLHQGTVSSNAKLVLPISGRELSAGTYFLRVKGESFYVTRRISVVQ